MTYKEKKEFLSGYLWAQGDIIGAKKEIEFWESVGMRMNSSLELVPVNMSGGRSKVENAAVKVVSIIEGIQKEMEDAETRKAAILEVINTKTKYRRQRNLLYWRFIRHMKYDEIAAVIGKDIKTVQRIVKKAVEDLDI